MKTYIGKTTENIWIFKAKSIKLNYKNEIIFYKDWFKKIYNKFKENNEFIINLEIDRYFDKSFKDFSVKKNKFNIEFKLW